MSSSLAIYCRAQCLSLPEFPLCLVRRVVLRLGDYITSSREPVVDLLPMQEVVWRNDVEQLKISFDRTEKTREKEHCLFRLVL
jgi:hypothetical protein